MKLSQIHIYSTLHVQYIYCFIATVYRLTDDFALVDRSQGNETNNKPGMYTGNTKGLVH